jgi:hypothetical protein
MSKLSEQKLEGGFLFIYLFMYVFESLSLAVTYQDDAVQLQLVQCHPLRLVSRPVRFLPRWEVDKIPPAVTIL